MASKGLDLPLLAHFDPVSDPASIGQRWKAWKRRFTTYLSAMAITDDTQKRALLLYQAGTETQDIFETLPDRGDAKDFAKAMETLDTYFSPKGNADYEIFKFRTAIQSPEETVDQFATRLRKLAQTCDFQDVDREIKSAIIQHCTSKRLRRFAFLETELSLSALLAKARAFEISEQQATGIETELLSRPTLDNGDQETAHSLTCRVPPRRQPSKPSHHSSQREKRQSSTCGLCGGQWPHRNAPCPAQGKTCRKCGKMNHFARVCRSKPKPNNQRPPQSAHTVNMEEPCSGPEEYLFALTPPSDGKKALIVTLKLNDLPVKMLVDTGASIDIIDESTYEMMQKSQSVCLSRPSNRIFAYGSKTQLPVLGKFKGTLESRNKIAITDIHIVQGNFGCLLSYSSATTLGLIQVNINKVQAQQSATHEKLIQEFSHIFDGIGTLKDVEVKLHIDPSVPPVAQPARRIPFHLRKKVEQELAQLEQQGIIEKVEGPTPFVSPLVIVPKKDGDVRLCVDMRMANKAIRRERHPTPTIDDLIHSMNGAKVFSKLDLRAGYHQLTLAPESRYITTFSTHKGLRRYRKLNFGTSSASEIFQHVIQEQLRDIPNAINISDDVIVYGTTQTEHDNTLRSVFQRLAEKGLTLNKEKCLFNQSKLTFFGFVFSSEGISPDPIKVAAIHDAPPPNSCKDVRSFLGLATYCSKFIPNFSDLTEPLRNLTKKNAKFCWTPRHEKAFQATKAALTSDTVMDYFDKHKNTELITDASPTGLSAILSQHSQGKDDRKIVAYISRALTPVEQKYSQTEREALAIVWAMERLYLYLFGGHFTLITDCKPVEMILNNSMSKPPARIERWNLRIQDFDFDIRYVKGMNNPSDFLSRHHSSSTTSLNHDFHTVTTEYLQFLTEHAVPRAMTLSEIQQATKSDATMQHLAKLIRSDLWRSLDCKDEKLDATISLQELQLFRRVKDELTVCDNSEIILRGSRIVLPASLRQHALNIAHEGHQGLVKTKQLLREKVWFPGIDMMAKQLTDSCLSCQATNGATHPEPLIMSELPPEPWHTLHIDFCGPFPGSYYLLVVVDAFTRFPEVEIITSTSAEITIPKLERIFATHGLPKFVKTDNGPPFPGVQFYKFMKELGANHTTSSPYWPQGNAEVERFMQPLVKAIKTAHVEGKDWKRSIYKYLLNYRATPHTTTGKSPAELLFNRQITTKLPNLVKDTASIALKEKDSQSKEKMKFYADQKRHVKESDLKEDDIVLVKNSKNSKLSTRYSPLPYKIVKRKGNRVTVVRNGHYITRNVSFFKKFNGSFDGYKDDNHVMNQYDDYTSSPGRNELPNAEPHRYPQRQRYPVQRYGQNIYST